MNAHTDPKTIANIEPRHYRVDWAVDLTAHSPGEAAAFACQIQEQPGHTATVFSVTDKGSGEITVHDLGLDGAKGTNVAAKRPEDTTFVPRTLRPGGQYQTRAGHPVEIMNWERPDSEFLLEVSIDLGRDGERAVGIRTKAGLHPQGGGRPHPLDVLEVNPTVTKWVRLYDRKLNPAGKQVVLGKEFAAERGLFMYLYDTEAEAKASLQGVRAVFPMSYREGEGLG